MGRRRSLAWQDDAAVIEAFKDSRSMTEIITKLGQPLGSASFLNCKIAATRLGLKLPIFDHHPAAALAANLRPLEEILVEHSTYTDRQSLKRRLIAAGLMKDACAQCGLGPEWSGKRLVIQVDHINGVGDDNRLENLQLLCPNCHSQTNTFCGKTKVYACSDCGKRRGKRSTRCRSCTTRDLNRGKTKISWPALEEVQSLVDEIGYSGAGRHLGVSDQAVRKHLVRHGPN